MNQATEEKIGEVLKMFEDRLLSRPGSDAWKELSRMLDGAPLWREELGCRWAGREDWQRFLEWKKGQPAATPGNFAPFPDIRRREVESQGNPENQTSRESEKILVEFEPGGRAWLPVVERLGDEHFIVQWEHPRAGLVRGCSIRLDVRNEAGEPVWAWDGCFEAVKEEADS
ncbi:MAG: hypothetical protein ACE15F_24770 [bacterium]